MKRLLLAVGLALLAVWAVAEANPTKRAVLTIVRDPVPGQQPVVLVFTIQDFGRLRYRLSDDDINKILSLRVAE